MDFTIHTSFNNKHITILLEDTVFHENGYETIISIIDIDDNGEVKEFSAPEYIKKYPEADEFIDKKIMELVDRNNDLPYKNSMMILK